MHPTGERPEEGECRTGADSPARPRRPGARRALRPRSALGVLRRLAGSLEAVLLAFLHARVARQEAGLAQRQAEAVGFGLEEGPGDAVADGPRLALVAAALDLDHGVVAPLGAGHAEGQQQVGHVDGVAEMLVQRAAVDDDLAIATHEADAGDACLAAPGAIEEGGGGHRGGGPPQASGSGCCAWCGWSAP